MNNRITVTLPFSFKGKTFRPGCTVDLDKCMESGAIPCLYTYIAKENRIDVYSHEYDVMMIGELEFEETKGMVAEFIHGGVFDSEGFQARWHERKLHQQLQNISTRCMEITDLDTEPKLKTALMEAYYLGENTPSKKEFAVPPNPDFD